MRQLARLSNAVPHKTAFLPPAFMAMLPPIQLASAEVGSTAKTRPARSAASATLRVTTPAPVKMVETSWSTPGKRLALTLSICSSFSVLITADIAQRGIAPPVQPVPPPRGIIVKPKAIQAFTRPGISDSQSGFRTTSGNSTRQSVASVTCAARETPSKQILSAAVIRLSSLRARLRISVTSLKPCSKFSTARCAAFNKT